MKNFSLKAYLVIGEENAKKKPLQEIVKAAVDAGFTMVQIRSKNSGAREIVEQLRASAEAVASSENNASLIVNDRLDIFLATRELGIKADGLHVGQSDIYPHIARKYMGKDAILGLSARSYELIDYVKTADTEGIDYFGAGPLHPTPTKPDAGRLPNGGMVTRAFDELKELKKISKIPIVVGGGVKVSDLRELKQTGVDGFFTVSAVTDANNPYEAALELVKEWDNS